MSTTTDTDEHELSGPVTFSKPGPRTDREALREALAVSREDDPPPDVPRDQYDQPIIVRPDGSGVDVYRRASSYGKIIEDEYTLTEWKKRSVAYGMSRGHHLVVKAQSVASQTGGHNIAALKDVCDRAMMLAGADAGAITGTGLHVLSQRVDAGEDLSWLDPLTLACLEAYRVLLAPFEVLAAEGFVVHDALGAAGSYDRIVRLPFDLVWPDGVVIEAGTVLVVDVKTGKVRSMKYWSADFTCQQLIYAEGVPYLPGVTVLKDPNKRSAANVLDVVDQPGDHGRVGWEAVGVPQAPSRRWSLILHVPQEAPWDAHWERVDLDVAAADAEVARQAWERHRVKRADRFLALPASALPGHPGNALPTSATTGEVTANEVCPVHGAHPGTITCPQCVDGHRAEAAVAQQEAVFATYVDDAEQPVSTGPVGSDDAPPVNPQLVAILHERITRCDRPEMIEQLYDAWHGSPSWLPEHDERCQEMFDQVSPPEGCLLCPDAHRCTACGISIGHGKDCCRSCELRLLLSDAPDVETITMLWDAHGDGPEGDELWRDDEHTPVAQARYDELTAPEYPIPRSVQTSSGVITLWCHECTRDEDPRPWCDCDPDDTCMDSGRACRNRAHDPDDCPVRRSPPERAIPISEAACPEHGPHGGTVDCPECLAQGSPANDDPATWGAEPEPGPFDDTARLAALREQLRQALDTETVDALYDAHGPDGDGLWDAGDAECNALAQGVYDRYSASNTGAGTVPL